MANTLRVTFDKRLKREILSAFGKQVASDGYLTDSKSGKHVLASDGEHILFDDFGGIIKGSWIYLKSDILSLIQYVDRRHGSR